MRMMKEVERGVWKEIKVKLWVKRNGSLLVMTATYTSNLKSDCMKELTNEGECMEEVKAMLVIVRKIAETKQTNKSNHFRNNKSSFDLSCFHLVEEVLPW